VLALGAILVLRLSVPQPDARQSPALARGQWVRVLTDRELLRLNFGIFALHAGLMALFVQVPFMLRDAGLAPERHWVVYLPVLLGSVVLMLPAMMRADSPHRGKVTFVAAVGVVLAGQALLGWPEHAFAVTVIGLLVFFTGFNLLEATL